MAKVKGTNRRTRQKRSYTKPGSKRGRGVKQTWKKYSSYNFFFLFLTIFKCYLLIFTLTIIKYYFLDIIT